ncbi:SUKH-4 family immunity protein [Streptomyces sp. NPDC006711]|uniref:SUKH-4 family immunity protein n=1 Tax=Streptomyces sp. NPDC006711 TaxID=3364762 RepID=UPI0036AFAE82
MVTFAQAQERAEEWINGDVPAYQHREVRVREFELGFVVWAEDRENGPAVDGGAQRLVIARDSGDASLWPALPVGEVIRRYEEEYGVPEAAPAASPEPPARIDLNQTSFLLSPPEWLQDAADRMGIPDRRGESASARASGVDGGVGAGAGAGAGGGGGGGSRTGSPASAEPVGAAGSVSPAEPVAPAWPAAGGAGRDQDADGGTPWAGTDTNAGSDDGSVPLPATVFAPALSGSDDEETPPKVMPEAKTALMPGGSRLPPTALAPAYDPQGASAPEARVPGAPGAPVPDAGMPGAQAPGAPTPGGSGPDVWAAGASAPGGRTPGGPVSHGAPDAASGHASSGAEDIADAATSKASGPPPGARAARGTGSVTPPPPGAPGTPGARPGVPTAGPVPGSTPPPGAVPAGATPPPGASSGGYLPTQLVSQLGPDGPQPPGAPTPPPARGDVHQAATMFADPSQGGQVRLGPPVPPGPPGAPGAPGTPMPPRAPGAPMPPGAPGVPQAQGAPAPPGPPGAPGAPMPPGTPGVPPGAVHQAATMFADPSQGGQVRPGPPVPPGPPGAPGAPGAPMPPGPPGAPGGPAGPGAPPAGPGTAPGGVHHAATMLAGPAQMGPGGAVPQPPGPPGMPPGGAVPQPPPAYGYPQQPPAGLPTVGPGYQAVLRYRAPDGSEQQLIRRSAPGIPHPEWQIFHELRAMNVPADHVLELHTELESCELPGGYCARMIREQWPQVRITHVAPYGKDHGSRRQGVRHLLTHQGELAQVADGPARPQPVRAPIPAVQPVPPLPPEGVAHELAGAFGPQGVFRFDQRAVSRQGVPEVVAVTLVWAGLPVDFGPFFWAQAAPGQPVPTLAELAQQRGVQPAADAGSYLVMGSDFGRAICVQYGTANIVAVPVEAGPSAGGHAQSVPPQFVNSGLPEFVRSLALLGRMWRLRFGLNPEQAGRWTVDFQAQLAALDPAALASPESWWSVLLEQMWDGLL